MALQPTNAGINFQQRVAAQFLSLMLTNADLSSWLPDGTGTLAALRFESADEIDDLVLENHLGDLYYVQAKRSLSLSVRADSPFCKAIAQFVRQFCIDSGKGTYYLAVSPSSSSAVNDRLRRILDNIRRNQAITNLCLNKSDRDILDTFLSGLRSAYPHGKAQE